MKLKFDIVFQKGEKRGSTYNDLGAHACDCCKLQAVCVIRDKLKRVRIFWVEDSEEADHHKTENKEDRQESVKNCILRVLNDQL